MKASTLSDLRERFEALIQPYFSGDHKADEALAVKKAHTMRVCSNARRISRDLGLSGEEQRLADCTALFHDFGRFEQYRRYGTFDDMVSCNHGHLSLQQMATHGLFRLIERPERRVVAKAIAFHNALCLPDGEDEQALLFMRLLRDADKIDILNFFAGYLPGKGDAPNPAVVLGLSSDPGCSEEALASLAAGQMVDRHALRTVNDFLLLQLSWVYDINYGPSCRLLKERGHLRQLASLLPDSRPVRQAVAKAFNVLEGADAPLEVGA